MRSKRELLKGSLLCVILDRQILRGRRLMSTAKETLDGGADIGWKVRRGIHGLEEPHQLVER